MNAVLVAGLLLAGAGFGLMSCGFWDETGRSYLSARGLIQDQESRGFIVIGTLGDSYPARVSRVNTAMHEISFITAKGERKIYSGYHGYKLKALKLVSETGVEVFVILRSKRKK